MWNHFLKKEFNFSLCPTLKINLVSADWTGLFYCSSVLETQMHLKKHFGAIQILMADLSRRYWWGVVCLFHVLFINKLLALIRLVCESLNMINGKILCLKNKTHKSFYIYFRLNLISRLKTISDIWWFIFTLSVTSYWDRYSVSAGISYDSTLYVCFSFVI